MVHHEKKAFFKFFLIYFLSVAILIIVAGFFYLTQIKNQFLKAEEFSMIEYARDIKMKNNLGKYGKEYRHIFINKNSEQINIKNFAIIENEFTKYIPINRFKGYLQVFKLKNSFDKKIFKLELMIASIQLLLLILFGWLSNILAKNALKPLRQSISTLDKFAKDLIHDLNTPVTSIKLNMKLLKKNQILKDNKALARLSKSVNTISELHENLTTLLQEETFQMQKTNICKIVQELVQIQEQIYPDLNFQISCSSLEAKINPKAMKQILQNIISNACKYNSKKGFIKIYTKKNKLYIEDSGNGIEEPEKIFERSYSEKHSSGIGLDIVKRLAKSMNIQIKVESSQKGAIFILTMS